MEGMLGIIFVVALIYWIFKKRPSPDISTSTTPTIKQTVKRLEFKEFYGDPQTTGYKKKFKTKAVGVTMPNMDGSDRQEVIEALKPGQKVRLVWDENNEYDSNAIMLFPYEDSGTNRVKAYDQFGFLKRDLAADVVRWVTKEDFSVYAEVSKILGGTEDAPTLGCLLEITVY